MSRAAATIERFRGMESAARHRELAEAVLRARQEIHTSGGDLVAHFFSLKHTDRVIPFLEADLNPVSPLYEGPPYHASELFFSEHRRLRVDSVAYRAVLCSMTPQEILDELEGLPVD